MGQGPSERYHVSFSNWRAVDVYERRSKQMLDRREKIKRRALQLRRQLNLGNTKCVS